MALGDPCPNPNCPLRKSDPLALSHICGDQKPFGARVAAAIKAQHKNATKGQK